MSTQPTYQPDLPSCIYLTLVHYPFVWLKRGVKQTEELKKTLQVERRMFKNPPQVDNWLDSDAVDAAARRKAADFVQNLLAFHDQGPDSIENF